MKNLRVLIRQLAYCAILVAALVTAAQAQTATFSGFRSLGGCYSAATTAPDPLNPKPPYYRHNWLCCLFSKWDEGDHGYVYL